MVELIFGKSGIYVFLLMILIFCIIIAIDKLLNTKDNRNKVIYFILIPVLCSIIAIYYYAKGLTLNTAYFTDIVFVVTVGISFSWFFIITLVSFFRKENMNNIFFVVLSPLMQFVMLFSPEYGPRTVIISALLLFIPLTYYIVKYFKSIFLWIMLLVAVSFFNSLGIIMIIVLVTLLSIFTLFKRSYYFIFFIIFNTVAFYGIIKTAEGYWDNYPVHNENARLIAEYKEKIAHKNNIFHAKNVKLITHNNKVTENEVLLQKYLPNTEYKYTMPYDDPYHLYWYKILNGLDPKIKIIFRK
jgi:hypothetical protein